MVIKDGRMDDLADLIVDARCALEKAGSQDNHSWNAYALKRCREAEAIIKDILGDLDARSTGHASRR